MVLAHCDNTQEKITKKQTSWAPFHAPNLNLCSKIAHGVLYCDNFFKIFIYEKNYKIILFIIYFYKKKLLLRQ